MKFAAVVATTITFLTVVVVFIPLAIKEGHSWLSLFSETNLFNHLITPLVGLLGFCLCEISPKLKFRHTPWGIVSVILYEIFYTFNYYFHWVDSGGDNPDYLYDWYGFTNGGKNPVWLVIITGVVAAYLITLLVYLLNVVFQHVFHDSPNLVEAEKDDRYRSQEETSSDKSEVFDETSESGEEEIAENVPENFVMKQLTDSFISALEWWAGEGMKTPPKDLAGYYCSIFAGRKNLAG